MSILDIVHMGHPALLRPARPVANPTDPAVRQLVRDMIATMEDAGGVGLAAPQVAAEWQIVVYKVPAGRGDDVEIPVTALINPELEPLDDEMVESYEACLSVPGLTGPVPRWRRIRYRGLDLDGQPVGGVAEGFHARVLQHECDHLIGRLYLTRMTDIRRLAYVDELRRQMSAAAEKEPA